MANRRDDRNRETLSAPASPSVAAALAIFALFGKEGHSPAQHVAFHSLPPGVEIAATLEPRTFGTEVHIYVAGIRSGTLCRVSMRGPGSMSVSAGSFRYRWGSDDSAVLSAALDLSSARALVVRAGNHTFVAPLDRGDAIGNRHLEEEST